VKGDSVETTPLTMVVTKDSGFLLVLIAQFVAQNLGTEQKHNCKFPNEWRGSFFLGGSRDSFTIDTQKFGTAGFCYRVYDRVQYTLYKRPDKCFQCLKVWERHENTLQYKLSDCVSKANFKEGDCDISEETPFETLLKLDGPNTPCPFTGAFNFTYKKEGKECLTPTSEVVKCMSESQSLLKFEVCPDDVKQETGDTVFYNTIIGLEGDTQETLTCKATWQSDLDEKETYMLGTLDYRYKRPDEERVRCFMVKETKRGIQVAQSSDATCYNNLDSSLNGFRTMKLNKIEQNEDSHCIFPEWASEMGALYSFSFSSKYEFSDDGFVLSLSNYSSVSKKSHELSRTICVTEEEQSENYVKMVTKVIANCDQMYKCVRMFKRTENIMEIQEGSPTNFEATACSPKYFDERFMIYTTLFREDLLAQPCPVNGLHNVTDLDLDGHSDICDKIGFTNINIKCGGEEVIEFYKECPIPEKLNRMEVTSRSIYHCLGGWNEQIPLSEVPNPYGRSGDSYLANNHFSRDGGSNLFVSDIEAEAGAEHSENVTIGYIVAMRQAAEPEKVDTQKRICFIYMVAKIQGVGDIYSWTVDKTACLRNIRPGHMARVRFNTTVLETCGARSFLPQNQIRWAVFLLFMFELANNIIL